MSTVADTFALAWNHHQAGRLKQAEELYRQIVQADARHPDAWCFLGAACQAQGRLAEAEVHYRRAIELVPNHPSAPNCLGIVLAQQGQRDKAADIFEELLRRQPADPEVNNNLGLVREKQGRTDEAVVHYKRALQVRPEFPDALNNLGNVLADEGNLKESLDHYDKAIKLRPDFSDAYFNRATPRLLLGDFQGGWADYEHRWRQAGYDLPTYRQPRWDGSALDRKTILLWAEQGLGDTLQFVRFAPLVKRLGARVIMASQPALLPLLRDWAGIDQLVAKTAPAPPFDVYAPLMSVPGIMGTTATSVPAEVPYLHADPALVEHWRSELKPLGGFQIGVAWQGNPGYRKDHQRSIPLSCFEPLSRLPGVRLISLQKGAGTEQLAAVNGRWQIVDLGVKLDEASGPFRDSAAIMQVLDLVISSDSAVAHLAGALAVPVWVALPRMPDWRWFLDREDCPWYPTMRLFRQMRDGCWDDVFSRMCQRLKELAEKKSHGRPEAV